jgi:hypothetical protein
VTCTIEGNNSVGSLLKPLLKKVTPVVGSRMLCWQCDAAAFPSHQMNIVGLCDRRHTLRYRVCSVCRDSQLQGTPCSPLRVQLLLHLCALSSSPSPSAGSILSFASAISCASEAIGFDFLGAKVSSVCTMCRFGRSVPYRQSVMSPIQSR